MDLADLLGFLKPKTQKKMHKLNFPLPEMRLTVPLKDVNETVTKMRKGGAKFVGGGEFADRVYRKEYGSGAYAYYWLRTDARTEKESLVFDGYMIQEKERLNLDVVSAYSLAENLPQMGYEEVFNRQVTERRFLSGFLRALVIEVDGLGDFLELALPETKVDKTRELQEKTAFKLLEKLGFKKDEVIPVDVLTIQGLSQQQPKQKGKGNLF